MPFKLKNSYRHKFTKTQYKLNNWSAYNEALKTKGKINFSFPANIVESWYYNKPTKKSPGRQKIYSNLAILTMRTIGTVFKQRLRQTEGLLKSIIELSNLDLQVPDYSTLSRRTEDLKIPDLSAALDKNEIVDVILDATGLKIFGVGEWLKQKHNIKKAKGWRKLHIAIDRETGKILASELTTDAIADHTPVSELLNSIPQKKRSISGDCAYDVAPVYKIIAGLDAKVIIPPRENAQLSAECLENYPARAEHIKNIANIGKLKWQKESGYNWRSLVETTMSRSKKIIGSRVFSKKMINQKMESKVGCYILNKVTELAMPNAFKFKASN